MIRLSKELVRRIENHGRQTYPEECCGILLGTTEGETRIVRDVGELANLQEENRRRRFLVTPREYLRAEKTANDKGLELLGFYHSHPDHPAIPSEFDRKHALPFFIYVVLSVERGDAKVMTAWLLSESRERFEEKPLSVEDPRLDKSVEEKTGRQ